MPSPRSMAVDVFALVLIPIVFVLLTYHVKSPLFAWAIVLPLFLVFTFATGHLISGHYLGAFIDDRNVISLSRLQMLTWAILVLSALMAGVLWNLHLGHADPIKDIAIDSTVWTLMGISTTSLVASPLILGTKKSSSPNSEDLKRTLELLPAAGQGSSNQGTIFTNTTIDKASWRDLVTGEETSNAGHLDLSRIQMLFITLVVLVAYGLSLRSSFSSPRTIDGGFTAFPELTQGLLALIAISHGGYLVMKAVPQSRTAPPNT